MKTEFEVELRRLDWFGAKSLIARLMSIRPVNFVFRRFARLCFPAKTAVRYPIAVPKVEYQLNSGKCIALLEPERDEVARGIYWGRGRCISASDQYTLDIVESLCKDAGLFLDIGAYSGLFALVAAAAQPRLKSMTFEIVPENHLMVMRNVVENDMIERIDTRLCGLSDKAGTLTVAPSIQLDRMASSISIGSQFSSGVQVPIETLDTIVGEFDGRIVMKIDVEGFETSVVRGGRRLFERGRPDVVCEVLSSSRDYHELDAMLTELGYRFFQIDDNGLQYRDAIDPNQGGRDWLFTVRKDLPPDLPILTAI